MQAAMLVPIIVTVINTFVLLAILLIPVLIGIYIFKDAKSKNMNYVLWTIIGVLSPAFIGLIIYLIISSKYSNLICSECKAPVNDDYISCPKCGTKLKPTCQNCSYPVEPDWNICPKCSSEIDKEQFNFKTPILRKSKALKAILIAVILIPIIAFLTLLFGISSFQVMSSGSMSSSVMEIDENTSEHITDLVNNCDENTAYIIREKPLEKDNNTYTFSYLIYLPVVSDNFSVGFSLADGLFDDTLLMKFNDDLKSKGNKFTFLEYTSDKEYKIKVMLNNKELEYKIIDVNFF